MFPNNHNNSLFLLYFNFGVRRRLFPQASIFSFVDCQVLGTYYQILLAFFSFSSFSPQYAYWTFSPRLTKSLITQAHSYPRPWNRNESINPIQQIQDARCQIRLHPTRLALNTVFLCILVISPVIIELTPVSDPTFQSWLENFVSRQPLSTISICFFFRGWRTMFGCGPSAIQVLKTCEKLLNK